MEHIGTSKVKFKIIRGFFISPSRKSLGQQVKL